MNLERLEKNAYSLHLKGIYPLFITDASAMIQSLIFFADNMKNGYEFFMIRIALYQPDIPQNTGAAMRLCACLGLGLDIIEPCGFVLDDKKIRRSAMDYIEDFNFTRHKSWNQFLETYQGKQRIILLTTKTDQAYTSLTFRPDDIFLAGRESMGAPEDVHNIVDSRITIPMPGGGRSLNIVNSLAMVTGEALRQTEKL